MVLKPESYVIEINGEFLIWVTDGDDLPYWISNSEGTEIIAFKTLNQAKNYINDGSIYDND